MRKVWLAIVFGAALQVLGAVYDYPGFDHRTATIVINCTIPFLAALLVGIIDDKLPFEEHVKKAEKALADSAAAAAVVLVLALTTAAPSCTLHPIHRGA